MHRAFRSLLALSCAAAVKCTDCIDTTGVSVSIRDYAARGGAELKINDPNGLLPSPFPVFDSWTEFTEDEIMEGG